MRAIVFVGLLIILTDVAFAQGRGPIEVAPDYALTDSRLGLTPMSASSLGESAHKFSLAMQWSNTSIFENPELEQTPKGETRVVPCLSSDSQCYSVDVETRKLMGRYAFGMGEGEELSITVPVVWRGGGVLDKPIENWHKAFGFQQGGRNLTADDEVALEGRTEDGSFSFEDGTSLGSIELAWKKELSRSLDAVTSLVPVLSLPTAHASFGHDDLDVGLSLLHSREVSFGAVHGGIGAFYTVDQEMSGLEYNPVHGESFVTTEFVYSDSVSFLLGLQGSSAMLSNVPSHPDYALYLDVGCKVQLGESEVHVLLRENPAPRSGSTDVTFLLGGAVPF